MSDDLKGRYIDADALVTVCLYDDEHEEEYTERMSIGKCLDLLTEEGCPNLVGRPQGEWIKRFGSINCSVCKHSNWSDSFEDLVRSFNYCPNCGARMKGSVQ